MLEQWSHQHAVALHFIEPGKPLQHAFCESFHSRVRDECLNEHWFLGLADARQLVEAWRQDDHQARPHSALGYQTPVEFAQRAIMAATALPEDDGLSSCLDQTTGAGQQRRSLCYLAPKHWSWSVQRSAIAELFLAL